jgi:hypothetical protein
MSFQRLSFQDILREEQAKIAEANDCHNPPGSPAGGQFCSKGGGGEGFRKTPGRGPGERKPITGPKPDRAQPWLRDLDPGMTAAGYHTGPSPALGLTAADVNRALQQARAEQFGVPPKVKRVSHKLEFAQPGEAHMATYRGMKIHTLPGYTTPYYYVDAPGFGSMQHTPSLGRIKNQINRFLTTGQTARGHEKRKASERYQKRKARYGR